MTKTVRIPLPNRGTGYRVIRGADGRMTTVPLTGADMALYRPVMAMDQAMPGAKFGGYGSGDDDPTDVDLNTSDNEGFSLEDKVRQLLEGKLDEADLAMLIQLIQPDEDAPAPAQDRKRQRQAHDSAPKLTLDALIRQRVAESGQRRAAKAQAEIASLMKRFPALKNARVA
jgi:hypothetical protein